MTCSNPSMETLYRGNTRNFTVTIKQDGVPVDITGDTVEMTLKEKIDDAVPVLEKTAVLTDPVNGVAQFTITSAESTAFSIRTYRMEVTWVKAGGERFTVLIASLPVAEPVADPD